MKCPRCQTDNTSDSRFCRACATPLPVPEIDQVLRTETLEIVPETSISGTIFAGRYKVVEELGRGGMGRVYRAYDNQLREEVALKIIKPEVASDKKALERFSNELKLARKIIHRNVCRLYELMEYQGVRFISMEYVPGEDLKSFIKRARRLDIGAAVAIAIQVSEGLAEAHRLGVVHRDLKPSNIMIDNEGSAKTMDFGIARSLLEKGITGEGRVVGTPEYISPEQIEGKAADPQSDLYALGVILFEMVCGTYPFEGDTSRIIAQKIQGKKPPNPKTINPHIPDDLAKVILKCLEKKEKRYQSADELFVDLRKIEEDLPTTERTMLKARTSLFQGITRQIGKRKIQGAVLGLLVMALMAILISRFWPRKPKAPIASGKPTLAVLFFANNTDDPSLDIWETNLCRMFIDEIRRASPPVTVLSEETIFDCLVELNLERVHPYSPDDLNKVAALSKASHILTGRLMKSGQNLRLFYDLKDARTAVTIGSKHQDGRSSQDFDEMIRALTEKVLQDLNIPIQVKAAAPSSSSDLADALYHAARDCEIRRDMSMDEAEKKSLFDQALQKYQTAIQADPDFALAYWGLGDLYESRYWVSNNQEDFDLMEKYYRKAFTINPNLAGPNAGLGWVYYYRKSLEEAYSYFKRAIELEPESPEINANVAYFLRSIGLTDKAIDYFTRAIKYGDSTLDTIESRSACYMDIGRFEEAAADAKIRIEKEPDNFVHRLFYARALARMKKIEDAEKELAIVDQLNPESKGIPWTRICIFIARGERNKALPILEKAKKENPFGLIYILSENYALLGMKNEVIEIVQLGIEKGYEELKDYLFPYPVLAGPSYDRVRADARFQVILKKQKEKYDQQREKFKGL